jgi:hypothetical protein
MKAKKAVKRLTRVEALLSNVIEQYAASQTRVRDLLDSAKESVSRARTTVSLLVSKSAKKRAGKAGKPKRRHLTAKGMKRRSLAAKKRLAATKRKGVQAETQEPLIKTA